MYLYVLVLFIVLLLVSVVAEDGSATHLRGRSHNSTTKHDVVSGGGKRHPATNAALHNPNNWGEHHNLPRYQGINRESISHSQQSIDCQAFMKPILERHQRCVRNSSHVVDICVYFAADYNYVIPFIAHHLALGFSKIIIYNNDEKVQWYNHPTVLCYLAHKVIEIQPWFGENALMKGLDNCYKYRIGEAHRDVSKNPKDVPEPLVPRTTAGKDLHVWGANFDIDEMLILHQDQCIGNFVERYPAPSIALNWAFFTPEFPLSDFARTGNTAFLSKEHKELINYQSDRHDPILLPHEMLVRRMFENPHIKTINRLECMDHFENEHCPVYTGKCPYGAKPMDPQGHVITCGPWTPWVDNYYPIAQLNHYWTLSLSDFLRKIHRGKGGSYAKNTDNFRHTEEFFRHGWQRAGFVNDTIIIKKYGNFFEELKTACPRCFDLSYYYMVG